MQSILTEINRVRLQVSSLAGRRTFRAVPQATLQVAPKAKSQATLQAVP